MIKIYLGEVDDDDDKVYGNDIDGFRHRQKLKQLLFWFNIF